MIPISKKQPGDAILAEDFNALVEEVRRLGRVTIDRSMVFKTTALGHQFGVKLPDLPVRLKITAITSGAVGVYSVIEQRNPADDIDTSADVTAADLGSDGSTTFVGIDENEIGRASHSHLNAVDDLVEGWLLKTNSDGTRNYAFRQAPANGVLFIVSLTQTAGSNGDKTHAASWTYTVTGLNGEQLATAASPEKPRPNGTATAATVGYAYYAAGALVLAEAYETYGTGGC